MFGWLRKKKKSKSPNIKISATQISDSKRRDMDTALEWLNDLLDNDAGLFSSPQVTVYAMA